MKKLLVLLLLLFCGDAYGQGRTLTVQSTNPSLGLIVPVTPVPDNNGAYNGVTPFTRLYNSGTDVALIASATAHNGTVGSVFTGWTGCDSVSQVTVAGDYCHLTLTTTDRTVIANYGPPSSPPPYRLLQFSNPASSGGPDLSVRSQCMNCIVSDGNDFYLVGGDPGATGQFPAIREAWKCHVANPANGCIWTRLADPPTASFTPMITYDSGLNKLVYWDHDYSVHPHIYTYDIASNTWNDATPVAGLQDLYNQVGVYSPITQDHRYFGGQAYTGGGSSTLIRGIQLSGATSTYTDYGIFLDGGNAYTTGFSRAHWIPSLNEICQWRWWNNGDNGLKCYNPVKNTWRNESPSFSSTQGFISNADNYVQFYVPQLNEIWTWSGSHAAEYDRAGARASGVYSFTQHKVVTWQAGKPNSDTTYLFGDDVCQAFATRIANCQEAVGYHVDAGQAWATNQSMGIVAGGSGSGYSGVYWLIVPNAIPGCEAEGGILGRTDILKCEGWESSGWWSNPSPFNASGWTAEAGRTNQTDGTRTTPSGGLSDAMSSQIVSSGCISGNCLKVNMWGWATGGTSAFLTAFYQIPGIGGCAHGTVGCIPQQEIYLRYYLKTSPNFDPHGYDGSGVNQGATSGGKFPGLADATSAPQCGNGGDNPQNGTECWSTRTTYQSCDVQANGFHDACAENGNPSPWRWGEYEYIFANYDVNGSRYGIFFFDSDGRGNRDYGAYDNQPCSSTFGFACGIGVPGFKNDRWYLYEEHVKMNDPGIANGVLESWVDGVLRYQKTNVIFRMPGHDNLGVHQFWLDVYEGGTGMLMKEDMAVYLDQMVIATSGRIGAFNDSGNPPGLRSLFVSSTNPQSSVPISLTPSDTNVTSTVTTPYNASFTTGISVVMVAPATSPSKGTFMNWSGCDSVTGTGNRTCSVTMAFDKGVTANYTLPVTTNSLLTINSNPITQVSVTYSPSPDLTGNNSPCLTNCILQYDAGAGTWTFCANENATCTFTGTKVVRYGSGSTFNTLTATGSISCNNATFKDPTPGVSKHCDYNDPLTVTLTAPTTVGTATFVKWQRDGIDFSTSAVTSTTVDTNHTMSIVYVVPTGGPVWPDAPPNLAYVCAPDGTTVTMSWDAVGNAVSYDWRKDYIPNNLSPGCLDNWYCTDPPDSFQDAYLGGTSITLPIIPNSDYRFWVDAKNSSNVAGNATQTPNFNCGTATTSIKVGNSTIKLGTGTTKLGLQ